MDITTWLKNAEAATPEWQDDNSHVAKRTDDALQARITSLERRDADDHDHERARPTVSRRKARHRERPSKKILREVVSISSASSSTSSSSESVFYTYERQPRHKTREDLYEPHSGARKRRSKKLPKEKARKHRKTHHPTRKEVVVPGKPGKGMMQKFQADNVPQSRLTLRHQDGKGLFSQGPASLPMAGRGLPDLTFSEMRFLKRRQQTPLPELESQKHVREEDKDGRGRVRAEETMAASRVNAIPLAEQQRIQQYTTSNSDDLVNTHLSNDARSNDSKAQGQSGMIHEKSANQLLTAGISATRSKDARTPQSDSDRPITWSQSGQGDTVQAPLLRQRTAISIGRLNTLPYAGVIYTETSSEPQLHRQMSSEVRRPEKTCSVGSKRTHRDESDTRNPECRTPINDMIPTTSSRLASALEGCDRTFDTAKSWTVNAIPNSHLSGLGFHHDHLQDCRKVAAELQERSWLQVPEHLHDTLGRSLPKPLWRAEIPASRQDVSSPATPYESSWTEDSRPNGDVTQYLIEESHYPDDDYAEMPYHQANCEDQQNEHAEQHGAFNGFATGHQAYPSGFHSYDHDEHPQDIRYQRRSFYKRSNPCPSTRHSGSRPIRSFSSHDPYKERCEDVSAVAGEMLDLDFALRHPGWEQGNIDEDNIEVEENVPNNSLAYDATGPRDFWRRQRLY